MNKQAAFDQIASMHKNPKFHFGVDTVGKEESAFIHGYTVACMEIAEIDFEEMTAFLEENGFQ